jgi:hypothetical protein
MTPIQKKQGSGGSMERFQDGVDLTELWNSSKVRKTKEGMVRSPKPFVYRPGFRLAFWIMLVAMSALFHSVLPACAQESSEMAKQAQNPIARLISVPVENDFNPQTGINKEDSYVLQFKPVVPFKLSDDWNLITRTIIPVIQVPELAPGLQGTTGLGDVQTSLFLSPAKAGSVIWGAGPVISFPTATQDILGTKKLSVGPTVVVLRSHGHWLFGTLVQNLFSVAGPKERADVNQGRPCS